jgi:uncharacterized protein YbjT (DUF2867 family)
MKVLVVGATGKIGRHAVDEALEHGHDVTALTRDRERITPQHDRLRVVEGDIRAVEAVDAAVRGQDAVISCLGTTDRHDATLRADGVRNVIRAMRSEGVRRLVVMSALGVGDSRDEVRRYSFFFGRVIMPLFLRRPFGDMARMEEEARQSGLDWVIVRPTELSDEAPTRPPRAELSGEGKGKPVPRAAVASFMVEQLASDTYVGKSPSLYG